MDIKRFKAWAESKKLSTDGETGRNCSYTFYDPKTKYAWEATQATKAQTMSKWFGDIQSWIAVNSFSALDAVHENMPIIDANELAKYIDSSNIDLVVPEGFVLVPRVITDDWMATYVDPAVSNYCKDYEDLPFSVDDSELPEIREAYRLPIRNAHKRLMQVIKAQEQSHV
ncbi:hypothetical protein B9T25_13130 [Acinetobacter sp. ANC 4470]|uniref:hypothetical protein n=1 Tax=Acinetobacter sp. ANC 4470 TaxID=1977881 RepID=UPI000A34DBFB|nr:hypothetical protein [Acinetobacter sp. ANC 4470]OTG64378.1 hypothetical protein B9T25_13130 [Acinetobacter sp. ANC 4470]